MRGCAAIGARLKRKALNALNSRRFWQKSPHTLAALLACLILTACGGGGAGPEPAPEVHKLAAFGDSMAAGSATEFGAALGVEVDNKGVPGTTSSQAAAALIGYPDKSRTVIIWAGHNNFRDQPQVLADVAAMVAAVGHSRFVVLGLVYEDRAAEYVGGADRPIKASINATLAATHPGHFLDTAEILAKHHNGSARDLADVGRGVTPASLRTDELHLTQHAAQLVAAEVAAMVARAL